VSHSAPLRVSPPTPPLAFARIDPPHRSLSSRGKGSAFGGSALSLPIRASPDIRSATRRRACEPRTPTSGFAAIAQLVEHVIRNDGVGGSSPSCGTNQINRLGKSTIGA
jgi:hypothetical protein